jgi:hypothetical protein
MLDVRCSTTLVNFRQRLLDHDLSQIGFTAVMEALIEAGLVARQSRQRLDSTQMFGRVSRMSRLDCGRESLRLALQELAQPLKPEVRPEWWPRLWERYVESQADYRAALETLARKMIEAGTAAQQLLGWPPRRPKRLPGERKSNGWPGCWVNSLRSWRAREQRNLKRRNS